MTGEQPEILVLKDAEVVHVRPLAAEPLRIGRGTGNDLVLADDLISWNHAVLWVEGDRVWVSDLGSRNGTFVKGVRIRTATAVDDGDVIQLGPDTRLQVRGTPRPLLGGARHLMLEDIDAGVRLPLGERFHIGSAPGSDLWIEDAPPSAAVLIVHKNGEVWLGTDTVEHHVDVSRPFLVAGRHLQVLEAQDVHSATSEPAGEPYPYALAVTLEGATGPEATLTDTTTGTSCRIEADNRAVLLYLLARQIATDKEAATTPDECGWCADEDIVRGIWGKAKTNQDANSLHVLVYRLRKELQAAGFDPWFIEKRRRYIRARVGSVVVT